MATEKTDFLKFNAYSMKELITRKMSEDSHFTDQIYEGSNLAILIDLVAYMYQVLVYQLNNAASESMFSDTQIYENISRLVKLIGYNPRGCKPSTMKINIYRDVQQPLTILKYSRIDTGLTDSNGNKIYFSVAGQNDSFGSVGSIDLESEATRTITLVNGQWKLYPQILIASGTDYETFTLDAIRSDSNEQKYIAGDYLDIYVKRNGVFDGNFQYKLDLEELLVSNIQNENDDISKNEIYHDGSQVFSLRLNENKTYEIKFGNGTTCKKLNPGDQLYIFYLETNGKDGEIDIGSVNFDELKFEHSPQQFGLSPVDFAQIFKPGLKSLAHEEDKKSWYTLSPFSLTTTLSKSEQSVEDIKEYAPQWFKTGNRLLTRQDYEFFVKSNIPQVIDVKCMNNWEYLASFYKWLHDCGVKYHQDATFPGRYYFEENRFVRNGFDMIDAADANNIYLWIKVQSDMTIEEVKQNLIDAYGMNYLKILTSEIQVLQPIPVLFDICACYPDIGYVYSRLGRFDDFVEQATNDSYLEVTIDDDCIYANSYIVSRIQTIFEKYFAQQNLMIGQNINISDILDEIYSIGGVTRVRTVFQPQDVPYEEVPTESQAPRAIDGISLMSWTNGFIEYGEDIQIGNVTRHLQNFQVPVFNGTISSKLSGDKIRVIKKQLTNISNIKF